MIKVVSNLSDKNIIIIRTIFLIILLITSLILFFQEKAILFVLFPIGIFLGYYSTIISKFIPHITAETMSIMSIVIGIIYGPVYAFTFGFVVSIIVYMLLSMVKFTTIVNSAVIGLGGTIAGILMPIMPFDLNISFIIFLIIRAILGIVIFWNITSDKLEAFAHAVIDPIFNIAIYMPIFFRLLEFLLKIKKG